MRTTSHAHMAARKRLEKALLDQLKKDERVLFVLAFGSTAEGKENRLSDTDICVVMKDDEALRDIMGEVNILFHRLGRLRWYYTYSPYHFYVVYDGPILIDLYLVSASLYFVLTGKHTKIVVDHRQGIRVEGVSPAEKHTPMVKDLLVRANIRTFRLLSKIAKKDFVTLVYILNSIRDEQVVPLLRLVYGMQIPHAKAVQLDAFDADIRELFIRSYPAPTHASCLLAICSVAELVSRIAMRAAETMSLGRVPAEIADTHKSIQEYAAES